MKMQARVIFLSEEPDQLERDINIALNSNGYDFYDYNNEITILIDDQGFYKSNNPVFEIVSPYGDRTQLAGRLLIVRNIENEFSVDIGSILYEDIFSLTKNLQIQLIGITKEEGN